MATNRMQALADVPLKNVKAGAAVLNGIKVSAKTTANPVEKASVYFDLAVIKADFSSDYIAAALSEQGFRVSKPLVSYWRNPERSELPNAAHIAALGPEFERIYHRCVSRVNEWGRFALVDLMQAMGDVAEELSA